MLHLPHQNYLNYNRRTQLLVPASFTGLTAGESRGVSPADVLLDSFRSRRLRRVTTAATPTRCFPLQVFSGDLAAADRCLVSPSGEVETSVSAEADLLPHRRSRGLVCILLFCRVLSVICGQLVQIWIVPVFSVFLT